MTAAEPDTDDLDTDDRAGLRELRAALFDDPELPTVDLGNPQTKAKGNIVPKEGGNPGPVAIDPDAQMRNFTRHVFGVGGINFYEQPNYE